MEQHNFTPLANQIPLVCKRLGIGRTLLYDLIKKGKLRTIKLGSRTLVPEAELQRLISEKLNQAVSRNEKAK